MALGGNPVFANDKNFNGRSGRGGFAGAATAPPLYTPEQLQNMYNAPAAGPAQTGRMSYDDVIVKTVCTLALVLVGAAAGWFIPALALPGALIGLVLGLVNSFKREPSPALILLYAAAEGAFLGGLSGILEQRFGGIVIQAVLGSLSVFAVTLVLFRSGRIRVTPKFTRFFIIALSGYLVFSLVNFGLTMFGIVSSPFGVRSMDIPGTNIPFGVAIGLLAVGLAAFSLVLDFDSIQRGVRAGLPARYSWQAAFGLTVTLVWLYVEILRLLAILRGND